ncbi:DUF1275 family protein [Rhodococcoides trifolii]|uniref:DUF1275 family protein n=1 Tax=Rhodococcoides trifolii TaxID=908250 RepID=A0A917LHH0_9NOCA|nr:YoaK family protein [Rhodococcus trifolii]GGG23812.1 DUF1275 family protein [Rhodococcus trifolii]
MTTPHRSDLTLGLLLSAASGGVDVLALTRLGGAFASVITGNVVVIGVSIGDANLRVLSYAGTAVIAYAIGVMIGHVVLRFRGAALGVEFALVLGLAGLWIATAAHPAGTLQYAALVLAALAMGVQSAAFTLAGIPGVSTTYFTGTLTGLVAGLVTGGGMNRPAASALCALLIGASATGLAVSRAEVYAVLIPFFLVLGALVLSLEKR